jgi:adenosylcobinamide-GDP ribazoletransferase
MGDIFGNKEDVARRWVGAIAVSASFLTRVPLPNRHAEVPFREAMIAFPIVGAIIGTAMGITVTMLMGLGFPPLVAAGAGLAVTIIITGGLHEDGLADVADGFGGGLLREQKLAIMHDSRIGSFGVIALVLALLIKAAAIAEIARFDGIATVLALAGSGSLSRAGMVWLLKATPAARTDGLGATAAGPNSATTASALAIGGALALFGFWWGAGFMAAVLSILLAGSAAAGLKVLAMRQIGGQTGDVCGALQMITEIIMLAAIAAGIS